MSGNITHENIELIQRKLQQEIFEQISKKLESHTQSMSNLHESNAKIAAAVADVILLVQEQEKEIKKEVNGPSKLDIQAKIVKELQKFKDELEKEKIKKVEVGNIFIYIFLFSIVGFLLFQSI